MPRSVDVDGGRAGSVHELFVLLPERLPLTAASASLPASASAYGLVLGRNRIVLSAAWLYGFARDPVRMLQRAVSLRALVRENEAVGFASFSASTRRDALPFCTIDDQVWVEALRSPLVGSPRGAKLL